MQLVNNVRDPDTTIVATFRQHAVPNDAKTREAGRPIFDDMEVCELRYPGRKDYGVYPAHAFSDWVVDPLTGEQTQRTYAERFAKQYRQFKEKLVQTKSGTPLDYALFLTEGRRSELRALNIYTVEQLAEVDGMELKNLGPQGRDLKNRAIEYLAESNNTAASRKAEAELAAAREHNALLEEDLKILKAKLAEKDTPTGAGGFADMSTEQLRDYIAANSGHAPKGDLSMMNRKVLIRMAESCKPDGAAA